MVVGLVSLLTATILYIPKVKTKPTKAYCDSIPQRPRVVRMVFQLKDQGESLTGIAESLTTAGILTKSQKRRWSTATIGDMIKRRTFYEGHYYDADNELKEYPWPSVLEG